MIPEGWKLVPIKPTEEMRVAGNNTGEFENDYPRDSRRAADHVWRVMLESAPSVPPEALRFVLPCELVVGAGHFGKGVEVSTAQGAIDRLYERMRLMESRLGELCYSCKLGIFHLDKSHQINLAPDAASGGTVVWIHDDCDKSAAKSFFPKRETIPSPRGKQP